MRDLAVDHPGAVLRPSPNFGPRRGWTRPDLIVIHYTGMTSGIAAENWLCDRQSEVSSHYLVYEDGRVVQMVRESDRAWHAGRSSWLGHSDVNSRSIGIELVNPGHACHADFPEAQIASLISLCRGISKRHGVRPHNIVGHSDVAPDRKIDPGEHFPWRRLHREGIGHYVDPQPPRAGRVLGPGDMGAAVEGLQDRLARYGYGLQVTGTYDTATEKVVAAFQRHFRPCLIDGRADGSTRDTLARLLADLPSA